MPSEVFVPSEYPTIQAGIDAVDSGGTVYVEAGLYTPATTILANKPVTILGAQANVDPRPNCFTTRTPGNSATETIVDGNGMLSNIFRILANDVTINGLEVRNGTGDLITSLAEDPIKERPMILYNLVHQATGDEGIQLRNISEGSISYNHVYDTFGDGINVCCGSTGSIISFNEVHDIRSPDAGIYVYESTNTTIERNIVYNVINNDGIKLGDADGADENLSGGNILNNIVHDVIEDGITLKMSDTLIEGNEIYNSYSRNGALFIDYTINNISISNNCIHDNGIAGDTKTTYGVRVGIGNELPTNVTVNFNNIFNNVDGGLFYNSMDPPPLDAENNWWGSPSGPNTLGADTVVGNVDYTPWLTEPANVCNPNIICPENITVSNDPGACSASVTYEVTARSNDCGITEVNCNGITETISPPLQSVTITENRTFPIGVTEVTCTATNASGDTAECMFTVTVQDTELPSIICPDHIVAEAEPGDYGAYVDYPAPTVTDNCSGVTYSCSPASGSFLPLGVTEVTCTAEDTAGNTNTCSFNISVIEQSQLSLELEVTLVKEVQVLSEAILEIQVDPSQPNRDFQTNTPFPFTRTECIRTEKVYDWVSFCTDHLRTIPVPNECATQIFDCRNEGDEVTVSCEVNSSSSNLTVLDNTTPVSGMPELTIVPIQFFVPIIIQYHCNRDDRLICEFEVTINTVDKVILFHPEGTYIAAEITGGRCFIRGEIG